MTTPSIAIRLLVASFTISVAIGLIACGDNDNGAGTDAANSTAQTSASDSPGTTSASAEKPATDKGQIKALVAQVQDAFKVGDGELVCDSLSEAGKRDIAYYGKLTGLPGSCVEIVKGISKRNQALQNKQPPADVVKIRVNGPKAVALIRLSKAPPVRQHYDKINGIWKIHSFRLGEAVGGRSPS